MMWRGQALAARLRYSSTRSSSIATNSPTAACPGSGSLPKFERMLDRLRGQARCEMYRPDMVKQIAAFAKLPVARELLCHGFAAALRKR